MAEDEGFLKAILASPEDDTLRLVYADWLEEHDDPRGEFIRVQSELARLPEHEERRAELAAREQSLLQQYAAEWAKPFAPFAHSWVFRRGFVEAVNLRENYHHRRDPDFLEC